MPGPVVTAHLGIVDPHPRPPSRNKASGHFRWSRKSRAKSWKFAPFSLISKRAAAAGSHTALAGSVRRSPNEKVGNGVLRVNVVKQPDLAEKARLPILERLVSKGYSAGRRRSFPVAGRRVPRGLRRPEAATMARHRPSRPAASGRVCACHRPEAAA